MHNSPGTDLKRTLIQRPPTVLGPTQTGDLHVLDGELVVVRDLLVDVDGLSGVDHDLLLRLHRDDLCITVGLKGKIGCYVSVVRRLLQQHYCTHVDLRCSCG